MRITNNMIMNNARVNINGNKVAVDAGDTQMTTQKKISRPSDDPVVAVRSLRLQTQLSKGDQDVSRRREQVTPREMPTVPDVQSSTDTGRTRTSASPRMM